MLHSSQSTPPTTNSASQSHSEQILSQLMSSNQNQSSLEPLSRSSHTRHQSDSLFEQGDRDLGPGSGPERDHFGGLVSHLHGSDSFSSNPPQVFALASHTDDENDVFQCGKCKQQFGQLQNFMRHKKECNSANTAASKVASDLADLELHLSQLEHHQTHPGRLPHLCKAALLGQPGESHSTTSMLASVSESDLSLHLSTRHRSSPCLVDAIGGSVSVNSILSESDLLSLTPSLDANMMVSIGNSISPSLLHLQGGDVSSNTDDFAQFAHINNLASSGESPISGSESRPASLYSSTPTSRPSAPNATSTLQHMQQDTNGMNSLMLNSNSPTSNQLFLDMIVTNGLPGANNCLLKSSFDQSNQHSPSNDNSIGSPSRFLNLPAPASSQPPISEASVASGNGKPLYSKGPAPSEQPALTVIHHRPSPQQARQKEAVTTGSVKKEITEEVTSNATSAPKQPSTRDKASKGRLPRTIKCIYCDRTFSKNLDLQNHIPCHTGEKPFECSVCGKAFSQKNNLRKHIPTHKLSNEEIQSVYKRSVQASEGKQVACKAESNPEVTSGSLSNLAISSQASSAQTSPDLHATGYPSKPALVVLSGIKKEKLGCPQVDCDFCTFNETELKLHCIKHSSREDENISFKCNELHCDQVCPDVETFLKHIQAHERTLVATTSQPGNGRCEESKKSHKTKPRSFRCQTCLNRYTTPAALEHHKANTSHHFPCQLCNKVFPCERYLRRHQLTHGAGLFSCKYCEKSFKTANYLKVHLIIHTGEKPFACKICDAAFNRRDKLKRHELVHDPVKRYKCPLNGNGCTREFNRPDKLKAHILTHSGVKPYQCALCSRSFTRRAHLREHSKTHELKSSGNGTPSTLDTPDELDKAESGQSGSNNTSTVATNTTPEDEECLNKHLEHKIKSMMGSAEKNGRREGVSSGPPSKPAGFEHSALAPAEGRVAKSDGILLLPGSSNPAASGGNLAEMQVTMAPTSQTAADASFQVMPLDSQQLSLLNNYILIYPCASCDKCFLKEAELKSHCCETPSTTTPGTSSGPSLTTSTSSVLFHLQGT